MLRTWLLFLILLSGTVFLLAGNPDSPATPDGTGSAMFTLEDIYLRLQSGLAGAPRGAGFEESTSGPGASTMFTLNQIMALAPVADETNGSISSQVLNDKKFWSLRTATWGLQTGTMPNIGDEDFTPGTTTQTISQGYHEGTGSVAGDADLVASNIATGVMIFNVTGTAILASGNAIDGQVLSGASYSNASGSSTGTMPDRGGVAITPGTAAQPILEGYHNGSGSVAGDPDLAASNIATGVNIFNVAGTAILSSGNATDGQVLSGVSYSNASGSSTGTIPDRGGVVITPGTATQAIAEGYHNGSGSVAGDSDLAASNIATGVNIFNVAGTAILSSGNATDGQVLSGVSYSNASGSSTGTMPDRGGVAMTPGTATQTILEGYHDGTGSVAGDADLAAGNIKSGVALFGVNGTVIQATGAASDGHVIIGDTYSNAGGGSTGTMPNRGSVTVMPGTSYQMIEEGYHSGTGFVEGDADLLAGNIRSGVNLFDVVGTSIQASGTATDSQVLSGETYSNAAGASTGTMDATYGGYKIPGQFAQYISEGYYDGNTYVQGDTDLIAGNIKSGVTIFEVEGTVIEAEGDADDSDVLDGITYSNSSGGSTGTMPVNEATQIMPGTTQQGFTAGYNDGTGYVEGDVDLVSENIRSGESIFGVAGHTDVVNTSSGDAVAADIQSGKKAWVDGAEITGSAICSPYPLRVGKTGVTTTYDAGDDGDFQNGVAWKTPRFSDGANGAVTDYNTGLTWIKLPGCAGAQSWLDALAYVDGLEDGECGLSDGSEAEDWRLPNINELMSLLVHEYSNPSLCSTNGTTQWSNNDPFPTVDWETKWYWTSNTWKGGTTEAWVVSFDQGRLWTYTKSETHHVWAVRGGE